MASFSASAQTGGVVRSANVQNERHDIFIQAELANIAESDDHFAAYDLSQPWDSQANQDSLTHHRFGSRPYQILAVVGPTAAWHPLGYARFLTSPMARLIPCS